MWTSGRQVWSNFPSAVGHALSWGWPTLQQNPGELWGKQKQRKLGYVGFACCTSCEILKVRRLKDSCGMSSFSLRWGHTQDIEIHGCAIYPSEMVWPLAPRCGKIVLGTFCVVQFYLTPVPSSFCCACLGGKRSSFFWSLKLVGSAWSMMSCAGSRTSHEQIWLASPRRTTFRPSSKDWVSMGQDHTCADSSARYSKTSEYCRSEEKLLYCQWAR